MFRALSRQMGRNLRGSAAFWRRPGRGCLAGWRASCLCLCRSLIGRVAAALALADACPPRAGAGREKPAQAQRLLDSLFRGPCRRPAPPPRSTSYAAQLACSSSAASAAIPHRRNGGALSGFCVRTCDGRFFRCRASGTMSPAEFCRSFCPGRQNPDVLRHENRPRGGADGPRYADLDRAFPYRDARSSTAPATAGTGSGSRRSTPAAIRR